MKVIYSDKHRLHSPEQEFHRGTLVPPFEGPFRAEWILEGLLQGGFSDVVDPNVFKMDAAKQVHCPHYLAFLESAHPRWLAAGHKGDALPSCFAVRRMTPTVPEDIHGALGYYAFAMDSNIMQGTFAAARSSMNCALTGASLLKGARTQSAFALCRPPGHHAGYDLYGGYCFLNNSAIAAQYLVNQGADRVAILDIDFHHGNGTQDIFYQRDDIAFASLHGDPRYAFPHFSGHAGEQGSGAGFGYNWNYPLPQNTTYFNWSAALIDALNNIQQFGAEAMVVSLGVDTYKLDPISFFHLEQMDYIDCGTKIAGAGLPTLFCMEGGYGVAETGANVANILRGFLDG